MTRTKKTLRGTTTKTQDYGKKTLPATEKPHHRPVNFRQRSIPLPRLQLQLLLHQRRTSTYTCTRHRQRRSGTKQGRLERRVQRALGLRSRSALVLRSRWALRSIANRKNIPNRNLRTLIHSSIYEVLTPKLRTSAPDRNFRAH